MLVRGCAESANRVPSFGMPIDRASVEALTNMISEVETLLSTTAPLPENRTARCLELLKAARLLAEDFARTEQLGVMVFRPLRSHPRPSS